MPNFVRKKRLIFSLIVFSLFFQPEVRASTAIHGILSKIAEAINMVINDGYSAQEKKYLDEIHKLRERYSTDTLKIKNATVAYMESRFSMPHHPWGELLFSLVRKLKPKSFLELGTCIGISGAYVTAGLEMNNKGKMLTLEHFLPLVPVANRTFKDLNFSRAIVLGGEIDSILFKAFDELAPIDIAFDDHIHEEKPVLKNFDLIYPFLNEVAVYLFDDIDHNVEMKRAWKNIQNDKRANITISLALGVPYMHHKDYDGVVRPRIGLVIIDKKSQEKRHTNLIIDSVTPCNHVYFNKNNLSIANNF